MASESRVVTVVPLNGLNYATWKVQCRMALLKEGLWGIVSRTEQSPGVKDENFPKFLARKDKALATIVLTVQPSLLYLISDPEDPSEVWQKLESQFQKRTWANKLQLRRKHISLRLKEGDSVQEHIKAMTEIFDGLSVIGDPISDEDRVVHFLVSLPESYNVLVTALEANEAVPKMEVVTERSLHEERKLKERVGSERSREGAMTGKQRPKGKGPKCHHCGKFGHIRRNCNEWVKKKSDSNEKEARSNKLRVNKAEVRRRDSSSSDGDCVGSMVNHVLSANSTGPLNKWIVDSGATCHMCCDDKLFDELHSLEQPLEVMLGDGYAVEATGRGTVVLALTEVGGKATRCKLHEVLYVPDLSYNLLSVPKATKAGKVVKFTETGCEILDSNKKVIAVATRVGSLYHLNCQADNEQTNAAVNKSKETKEDTWHWRYGHLGVRNLQKLAKEKLVDDFDFNASSETSFCESCVEGNTTEVGSQLTEASNQVNPWGWCIVTCVVR